LVNPGASREDIVDQTRSQLELNSAINSLGVPEANTRPQNGPTVAKPELKPEPTAKDTSAREFSMGSTPGKGSRTGQAVISRMLDLGQLRINGSTVEVLNSRGQWVDVNTTDMSHVKDAVREWNENLKYEGPKSPEVRKWMLDPKNYKLDSSGINRSEGAKLKKTYDPPMPYKEKEKD